MLGTKRRAVEGERAPAIAGLDSPVSAAPDAGSRAGAARAGWLREPLLHFLLLGGALFLLQGWRGAPASVPGSPAGSPSLEIVVERGVVDRAVLQFAQTWQRAPTDEERRALVEEIVRNEIYYREAVAAGLDRDDEVLQRRLRQKMEFLHEDVASWAEPADAELQRFLEANRTAYLVEPEVSFRQVFVSSDRRGAAAGAEADRLLAQLRRGVDPDSVGDATMLPPGLPLSTARDIGRQFGEPFAAALLAADPGTWTGPVRSGYGLHLVRVEERTAGRLPALADVRDAVKRDWMVARQKELKEAAYARIRERYRVTVPAPEAASDRGPVPPSTNGRTP